MQLGRYMEKGSIRKLVIFSALAIILVILTLIQDSFLSYSFGNEGGHNFQNRRISLPSSQPLETESIKLQLSRLAKGKQLTELESTGISCSSDSHTDECLINKPIIFDKQSLTIYIPSNDQTPPTKKKIKPYPRKDDQSAMDRVSPLHIMHGNIKKIEAPACEFWHNVPAMIFSFGGFSENTYHEFNELIIPLFLTTRHFKSEVQFVVTDYRSRWIRKLSKALKNLSRYEIIDADVDETVHCFPAAIVGLRYHDMLGINSTDIPEGYTIASFKQFLMESYNLKVESIMKPKRPKLLLLSRPGTRKFLNEDEMVKLMKNLGFQVKKALPNEMSKLGPFAQTVNSFDIMVGCHGAGLTNQVFLPKGAVLLQIAPLGLDWGTKHFYADPAIHMGLKYLEYKVQPNETTLYDVYGPNDPVFTNPQEIWDKGYSAVREVYLENQDLRIDLDRFRSTLLEALKLLRT